MCYSDCIEEHETLTRAMSWSSCPCWRPLFLLHDRLFRLPNRDSVSSPTSRPYRRFDTCSRSNARRTGPRATGLRCRADGGPGEHTDPVPITVPRSRPPPRCLGGIFAGATGVLSLRQWAPLQVKSSCNMAYRALVKSSCNMA